MSPRQLPATAALLASCSLFSSSALAESSPNDRLEAALLGYEVSRDSGASLASSFIQTPLSLSVTPAPHPTRFVTDFDSPRNYPSQFPTRESALDLSLQLTEAVAFRASLGVNATDLSHPSISPLLNPSLDSTADSMSLDGSAGFLFQITETVRLGLSYKTPSAFHSNSAETGPFVFDSEVVNRTAQMGAAGLSWQPSAPWRFIAQLDWIDWSHAFDNLQVRLRNGNSTEINLEDDSYRWQDQFVLRGGAELALSENVQLRAGYSFGRSPTPTTSLLPVALAIVEHTIGAGIGWTFERFTLAAAYQVSLPAGDRPATAALIKGLGATSHALALTASFRF